MKNAMLKNLLKFFGAGIGIVALAIGAISGVQYLKYRYSPEYKAEREIKNLIKAYEEDPYGGDTPEETLRLFIDALKKGDTDLAAKYFVMEKREKEKKYLHDIKEKKLVARFLQDLNKLSDKYPFVEGRTDRFIFEAFNENKELVLQANLVKNKIGKWKIEDL